MKFETFPWLVINVVFIWVIFLIGYLVARWRQKPKNIYIIPRVFVLCSPRTVQFHYELILRVGLPSYDFNPDRHDIDLTVLGVNNNEVVPMTRLNTRTLSDEPLITSLSLVVYRLVEMPALGSIVVCHSGNYKSWVYAYDFTVINLTTNKEQYYTLNQYVGSINRTMALHEVTGPNEVHYPIDDVPLPHWQLEDMFLMLFLIANSMLALNSQMDLIHCRWIDYLLIILFTTLSGLAMAIFYSWLLHYQMQWDQDRRDFFNDYKSCRFCCSDIIEKLLLLIIAFGLGSYAIYNGLRETDWHRALMGTLINTNSFTWVGGILLIARHWDIGMALVRMGLNFNGVTTTLIGLNLHEMSAESNGAESVSRADEDASSSMSIASRIGRAFVRSSVKSYGFDLTGKLATKMGSRLSSQRSPSSS